VLKCYSERGIEEFGIIAAQELETHIRKNLVAQRTPKPYMYVARLLNRSGDYFRSIWLTSDLSSSYSQLWHEFPDHIFTYYPRPYVDQLNQAASLSQMEPNLLLSIARQESSFRPKVESPAGAIGLMQLLPSTAQVVAERSGLVPAGEIDLKLPMHNLTLGSAYLAELKLRYKDYMPAIIAAYNAGEYAVDAWLERRHHPDPLIWCELIPFQETNHYVKNVWRNLVIYRHLDIETTAISMERVGQSDQ
jgi:soluble lytic murein transglycosylase-like protein